MPRTRDGIVVLVAGYPPAYLGGGPIRTVEAMIETRAGTTTTRVITSGYDHGASAPLDVPLNRWVRRGRANVLYVDMTSPIRKLGMYQEIYRARAKVLYLNSLLSFYFSILPLALHRAGILGVDRVVVAPRGELDPGALRLKRRKKSLFLRTCRALGLHRDVLWHASSDIEAGYIRNFDPSARVVVKQNETLVHGVDEAHPPPHNHQVTFAYLGRVSEKKRVHTLIEAAGLVDMPGNFRLVIHGGGDPDYVARCKSIADHTDADITFSGAIEHEDVADAFDSADYACFATAGENFGHVVAEAMARGCPVLIGDVTPWTQRILNGGGVILADPSDPSAWARTMRDLVKDSGPDQRINRRRAALASFRTWDSERDQKSFLDLLSDKE
jgi:glycosyltransferase involved in cell wall biosynthesis